MEKAPAVFTRDPQVGAFGLRGKKGRKSTDSQTKSLLMYLPLVIVGMVNK